MLVLVFLFFYYRKQRIIYKQQQIIQKKEDEKIQQVLDTNKQELTGKALSLVRAERVIENLKEDIIQLIPKTGSDTSSELKGLVKRIKTANKGELLWKEFADRFNELNDGFIGKLTSLYPGLSPAEIRMCAMLRLQLSTKEIAEISHRSTRTIEVTRTNIRKKMGLKPVDSLTKRLCGL